MTNGASWMSQPCDACERTANGESPDCVYFLRCGHAVCDDCSRHKPAPPHPKEWCPLCKAVVDGPYALPVRPC